MSVRLDSARECQETRQRKGRSKSRDCLSVSQSVSHSFSLSPKTDTRTVVFRTPRREGWRGLGFAERWCRERGGGGRGGGGGGGGGGVVYVSTLLLLDRQTGGGARLSHSLAGLLLACCLSSVCPSHPQRAATCECGEPDAQIRVRLTKHQRIEISRGGFLSLYLLSLSLCTFFYLWHFFSYRQFTTYLISSYLNPNPVGLPEDLYVHGVSGSDAHLESQTKKGTAIHILESYM